MRHCRGHIRKTVYEQALIFPRLTLYVTLIELIKCRQAMCNTARPDQISAGQELVPLGSTVRYQLMF